jgi:hypothetical protein
VHTCNLGITLGRLRQEDHQFKVSLGDTERENMMVTV